MRSFAIIGMSNFGAFLTRFLAQRGFQIMAIDSDEAKIEKIKPYVQKAVIADATDKETLANLGLSDVDVVVVSLGERIDASILVTLYLKEMGVKEIIVKVLSEDHGKILEKIGATGVIFPERDMAYRIAQSLGNPNVLEYIPLSPGYSIIEIAPPPKFVGKTLKELDLRNKYGIQIIVIKEVIHDKVVLIPKANHVVKDSDILVALGRDEDLRKIQSL